MHWATRPLRTVERLLLATLAVLFLFPLSTTVGSITVYPFDVALMPLLAAHLVRRDRTWVTRPGVFLALFAGWILTTSLLAPEPWLSVRGGLLWARAAVLFAVVRAGYGTVYSFKEAVATAGVLLAVQGSLATVQGLTQASVGALNQYFGTKTALVSYRVVNGNRILRAQGTLGNPNTVASWFVLLLPLLVTYVSSVRDRRIRAAGTLCAIVSLVGLAFTYSRGALLVLGGTAGIYLAYVVGRKNSRRALVAGLVAILGGVSVAVLAAGIRLGQSLSDRMEQAKIAVELFLRHPLVGVGYNNFVTVTRRTIETDIFFRGDRSGVHNIPLLVLSETGLVGFLLFAGAFATVYWTVFVAGWRTGFDDVELRGYALSLVALLGLSQVYLTPTSFQFLPLPVAVCSVAYGAARQRAAG